MFMQLAHITLDSYSQCSKLILGDKTEVESYHDFFKNNHHSGLQPRWGNLFMDQTIVEQNTKFRSQYLLKLLIKFGSEAI